MSEAEKGGEQQVVQREKSELLEEPLRGPCETLEAASSRLSEAVEAKEKGSPKEDPG
jgi:hypothetical protein